MKSIDCCWENGPHTVEVQAEISVEATYRMLGVNVLMNDKAPYHTKEKVKGQLVWWLYCFIL